MNGASLDIPDENGATPLINAVEYFGIGDDDFKEYYDFLGFLIDLTDFSIVHERSYIFFYPAISMKSTKTMKMMIITIGGTRSIFGNGSCSILLS